MGWGALPNWEVVHHKKGMTTRRRRVLVSVGVLLLVAFAAYALWISQMSSEMPKYDVVERIGDVELRAYGPKMVAETVVDGPAEDAGNQGFRILASYIFGKNQPSAKIAMTSPVTQEPQRIAMTSPVTLTPKGSAPEAPAAGGEERIDMTSPVMQDERDGKFVIQFMMPSKYTRATLPEPTDERITIREVPGQELAAIRYSGSWSIKRYEAHLQKLITTLEQHGFQPVGEPVWARYDPPFKPWFMRRNEVLVGYQPR